MSEEGGKTSIAARIAALKLEQVGRAPGEKPSPPRVPNKRPEIPTRQQSVNVPPLGNHVSAADAGHDIGNQPLMNGMNETGRRPPPALPNRPARSPAPSLPPRRPSAQAPQLPARKTSQPPSRPEDDRRISSESTVSTRSSVSATSTRPGLNPTVGSSGSLYTIRAPSFDPSALPPLPPKRTPSTPEQTQITLQQNKSSPNVLSSLPQRPPLPSRNSSTQSTTIEKKTTAALPKRSALSWGMNEPTEKPPALPSDRPGSAVPPPVPTSSRPDLSKLLASKPTSIANGSTDGAVALPDQESCLKCRDFSMVDTHAARFSRESLPSQDLGWLAHQLTSPFPSLTDKARAIFTWLHHNIDYNTVDFYAKNIKPSTPASTFATGLAVCEGYAALFHALASKVGMESMVVTGHGKGAGFQPLKQGESIPPESSNHAWNVVKIDNGQWKLLDSCWGAGVVGGPGTPYKRMFSPVHFYQSNEDFGRSHFPTNKNHFFRYDGRQTITWAEYMLGETNGLEAVQTYGNMTTDEGIDSNSVKPLVRAISVRDPQPYIRFQFNKLCPHWDNQRHGQGEHYLYLLILPGINGGGERKLPFQTNGQFWWLDVAPRELGQPGQEAKLAAVTSNGKDGRGLQADDFDLRRGCSYAFAAMWQIAS